jgi:pyruvate dehydrogenase E2 component (dihydrolipoamide acetyltransferase)
MPFSVVMPAIEMAQETGKLVAWRKKEGDHVAKGEPLLEVETDKAVLEVEAPAEGILAGVTAAIGAEIPVGQTIAWIVNPGETPPQEAKSLSPQSRAQKQNQAGTKTDAGKEYATTAIKISPKARRLAKEQGVDIIGVRGSGPTGEILAEDILAAAKARNAASPNGEPLSAVARLMAERTTQSWTTVPHFFLMREIDAQGLVAARDELTPAIERSHGVRLTYTDILVALAARMLVKHPRLNASWSGDRIRLNPGINIAVAIAVNDGVIPAVMHQADRTSLAEIAAQRRDLTVQAKAGRLRPADIAGATFTVSNLGMYGVDSFSAIITPPQAAVLALGRIADRIVPVDGHPRVRPILTATLSCDHRVVDGARAAAFLNAFAEAVQRAAKAFIDDTI